jgi:hypothetical protein
MSTSMRVEDRLDGEDNFRYWKHRVLLILEENDLLDHVKKVLPEPEQEEAKEKFKKTERKPKSGGRDIYPSSDSRSKGILDLVHSEEAQELEAMVTMSPTVYDNSNGTATIRLQVCISGLIFYTVAA